MTDRPTPETDAVIAANHENGWTGATGIEMLEELARQLENDRDALRKRVKELNDELDHSYDHLKSLKWAG